MYRQLRDEIVTGALLPGGRLSVPAIAERLNVSRSPVRDAIVRLLQDRLAAEIPRKGATVATIDSAELVALYEVREVLEGLAARLAVDNAGRKLVRSLEGVVTEHQEAIDRHDLDGHTKIDVRFHALIRQASANPELIRSLDDIQTRVRLAMRTTTVVAGPSRALADHRAILAAIADGNSEAAETASRAHIARLRAALAGPSQNSAISG